MTKQSYAKIVCSFLIYCLLLASFAFGQASVINRAPEAIANTTNDYSRFLIDESQFADSGDTDRFQKEAFQIVKLLSSPTGKSPVLIDDDGTKRDLVMRSAAMRLTERSPERKLVKIDWNALYTAAKTQSRLDEMFRGILQTVESERRIGFRSLIYEASEVIDRDQPCKWSQIKICEGVRISEFIC